MKTFKLFANCIPVKGYARSIIYDLQREQLKFIPNDLFTILSGKIPISNEVLNTHYNEEDRQIVDEYFEFLEENEFGFWTDIPDQFPEMGTFYEAPSVITNGIIDFNKNSSHDVEKIFKQYIELGCKNIQLRFFDEIEIEYLDFILSKLLNTSISVEIILKYNPNLLEQGIDEISKKYLIIASINVHSSPFTKRLKEYSVDGMSNITFFQDSIDSSSHCGIISKDYFVVNKEMYIESLVNNSCLNRKISIDVNGEIKNCPSMDKSFGNVSTVSFKEILKIPEFTNLWKINKDQILVCQDCEFRYSCTDCRAFLNVDEMFKKPKKCSYNPYSMQWEYENIGEVENQ